MRQYLTVLLLLLGAVAVAGPTQAQEISFMPGEWRYSVDGVLGPAPLSHEGTECVREDEAQVSLKELVDDLDNECTVTAFEESPGMLKASMVCTGNLPMSADAVVERTGTRADAKLTGTMFTGSPLEAPISLTGTKAAWYLPIKSRAGFSDQQTTR